MKKKSVLAHVHLFPGEKPKLNQGVKQMLLQGSLKRRCVPYLTDRNRQAVPGFRCLVVRLSLATGRCCFGKGEVDFRGACGIGRLIRWVVIEDIMSNEADTVGIEMWDGKNFRFMEKRSCMIIRGSFENVTDQLLLNNEYFIKWVEGALPQISIQYTILLCATALSRGIMTRER